MYFCRLCRNGVPTYTVQHGVCFSCRREYGQFMGRTWFKKWDLAHSKRWEGHVAVTKKKKPTPPMTEWLNGRAVAVAMTRRVPQKAKPTPADFERGRAFVEKLVGSFEDVPIGTRFCVADHKNVR